MAILDDTSTSQFDEAVAKPRTEAVTAKESEQLENHRKSYLLEDLFGRILSPFERFLRRTTAGGIILMGTTVLTLILANTAIGKAFHEIWEQPFRIEWGSWALEMSVHALVNDGLMAFFFLLVGLELKREILVGELSHLKDAALPVVAATGGMIVPGLLYYALNAGSPAGRGWGIPMATDIAFSIGILVLLAWRVPRSLIIFLTALAIADDLGAVLIIALFYTSNVNLAALAGTGVLLLLLLIINQGGIRHPLPYALLGLLLWYALRESGIHATTSGVLLAFAIPARPAFSPLQFKQRLMQLQRAFHAETLQPNVNDRPLSNPRMATIAENLEQAARAVQSPLQHMEHVLSPWVTFLIIPIFALSNAAIDFREISLWESLSHPITLGVILGLVVGKFLGISLFSWVAVKAGFGKLPSDVTWWHLLGVAWLAGIGFTMSLFISQLAFDDPVHLEEAKIGILVASLISGVIGLTWLYLGSRKKGQSLVEE